MEKQGKKKIGIIIAIIFAVVLAIGIVLAIVLKKNDKAKLLESAAKLVAELDEKNVDESMKEMDEMMNLYATGEYAAEVNVSVKTPAYPKTLTITGEYAHSQANKGASATCSVGVDGEKALDVIAYADEDEMLIQMPDVLGAGLVLPLSDFGKKYNHSVLAKYQQNKVDEDFKIDLFQRVEEKPINLTESYSLYGKTLWKIISTADVTLLEDQVTYEVKLPKETLADAFDSAGLNVTDDVILQIETDAEGNICQVRNAGQGILDKSGNACSLTMDFEHKETLQSMQLYMKTSDTEISYAYQFDTEKHSLLTTYTLEGKQQEVTFEGKLLEDGQVKIDNLTMKENEELIWQVDGLVSLGELNREITASKPAKEYRIFEMNELDIIMMITEIGLNGLAKLLML